MFWKRKSKKQEGQEATDSAAEVVEDTAEETEDAVESEKGTAEATGAESPESADAGATDSVTAEKAEESEVDATEDTGAEKADAAKVDVDGADTEKADTETDRVDAGASEGSAEDADASEKADDASEKAEKSDDAEDEAEVVGVTGPDSDGITRVRTAGVFEFGDEKFDIISNTWIVEADKDGVIVIDPAHDAEAIMNVVGDREIYLVACTNGYSPHIAAALAIAEETEADIALHPREMRAWRRFHGAEHRPEIEVEGGGALDVGDLHVDVLSLPGTSTGTVGYYVSQLGTVFAGDTLHKGAPGQVGDTHLDYTTQLASIGEGLLTLPPDTRILPDRGPSTTVEAENKNFDSWV
ncbi:MBL fold metallo-hydrolase [Nocardiopsis sp. MG754419]|uniref:MBL fold metallo-hydrolase n=1 Tax=Nocardiopsis sp. MG754419 TaxID=2259865 RepID=UPI001BAABAF6|nr:MBL fold metallo-hydrolase [Nocardiopsis sp. MG754419]MBR8744171.1 MBL fold metallo-hydrolase [Nocardiopsis sp. MG754419]